MKLNLLNQFSRYHTVVAKVQPDVFGWRPILFLLDLRLWLNYSTCWINRHFSWWGINLFLLKSLMSWKSSIFLVQPDIYWKKPWNPSISTGFFQFFLQKVPFWHREVVPKKHRFSFVVPPTCCSGDVLRLKPTDHLELNFAVPENVEAFNVATWAWHMAVGSDFRPFPPFPLESYTRITTHCFFGLAGIICVLSHLLLVYLYVVWLIYGLHRW